MPSTVGVPLLRESECATGTVKSALLAALVHEANRPPPPLPQAIRRTCKDNMYVIVLGLLGARV
eukprot:1077470-Amphidinium_carterae.1